MTVKVRILQKRLLEQCTKVFDKDLQVQEMQTRYEKLKDEFIKLPGIDTFEEVNNMKRTLMKKEENIKVTSVEITRLKIWLKLIYIFFCRYTYI